MAAGRGQSKPPSNESIRQLVTAAKSEGRPDGYVGKREHTRYTTGMRLEVTLDPNKPEEITAVVMHNVSDGGFAFWFRRSLPGRTIIYVRESDGETFGEWLPTLVRHCTRGLLGFLVGAQFDWEDEEASPASAPGATSRSAPRIVDTKAEHLRRLVRRQFAAKRP